MRPACSNRRPAAARIALAVLALVIVLARIGRAQLAEERLPAVDRPAAMPQAHPTASGGDADWQRVPANGESAGASEPAPPEPAQPALAPTATITAPATPTVLATPASDAAASSAEVAATPDAVASAPPAALDLSATKLGPDLSAASLEPEFKQAATPARAAALRLTEQARRELLKGGANAALQDLGRAVSIDPGNPFEYYYLGRVYLTRHNFAQAATFFHRAELGFAGRPNWLGETLSLAGACNEQLGQAADAVKAYQRAITLAPDNFRAQIGLGRLAPRVDAAAGRDQPAPSDQSAAGPPAVPTPPPAPDVPPAPPAADPPN